MDQILTTSNLSWRKTSEKVKTTMSGWGMVSISLLRGLVNLKKTQWARNQSYANGKLKYDKYAVFKAKIVCDRVLDTTNTQGLAAFNTLRNALIKKHDDCFQKNRDFRSDDRVMWNLVAQTMKLDAVVHNLYIKDRVQRIKKIGSNVPNTTVLCVKVPTSIVRETIEVVCDGEVRQ